MGDRRTGRRRNGLAGRREGGTSLRRAAGGGLSRLGLGTTRSALGGSLGPGRGLGLCRGIGFCRRVSRRRRGLNRRGGLDRPISLDRLGGGRAGRGLRCGGFLGGRRGRRRLGCGCSFRYRSLGRLGGRNWSGPLGRRRWGGLPSCRAAGLGHHPRRRGRCARRHRGTWGARGRRLGHGGPGSRRATRGDQGLLRGRRRTLGLALLCSTRSRGFRRCVIAAGGRLRFLGLFGLFLANEPLAVSLAAHAVSLSVDNTGGVTARSNAERFAQIEGLLITETELACKLIDADLGCQLVFSDLS